MGRLFLTAVSATEVDGGLVAFKDLMEIIKWEGEASISSDASLISTIVRNEPDACMLIKNSEEIGLVQEGMCAR